MHTILLLILAGLSLLTISLQRTYQSVPVKELKRRAQSGDEIALLLHRAASYGHSLRAVLWFLVGISNAAFFLLAALYTPAWFAFTISAALIWVGFVWLPARDVSRFGQWLAVRLAPVFAWLLYYAHNPIDRAFTFIRRIRPITIHTGLYDRYDLLDLLERQQVQADNRIEKTELEIARHALSFGDKLIRDVMVPRRSVKMVSVDDAIGPVLMAELHDSGHSRFPVYEGKQDNIVGTLFLRDAMKTKSGGLVKSKMRPQVGYLHEDQGLGDALQAILKLRHHLFIVVNSFEEFVGIITIEDVLEQIVGKPIIDEFDEYENIRAVAERAAKLEHKEHTEEKEELIEPETLPDEKPTAEEPAKVVHKEDDIDETIVI
jgi:CBS domain containing-hemolysin-like protein